MVGYPTAPQNYVAGYPTQSAYPPQSVGANPSQGQLYMTNAPMDQMTQPACSASYQQDPSKVELPPAYTE